MFIAFKEIFTLENLLYLLKGTGYSVGIAILSLFFGLILGILGSCGKRSKNIILKGLANIYVEVIRGTPMLLQILIIFSVIPSIYTAFSGKIMRMNPYLIGVVAMSINSGAYQTELIRSGINAVDKGQTEACETLGLSKFQTMKFVILPQAFKHIVPPMISELITLTKDTSLISAIGAVKLLKGAQILGTNYYDVMSPYCIAAVYYLIITIVISLIGKKIEMGLALSD